MLDRSPTGEARQDGGAIAQGPVIDGWSLFAVVFAGALLTSIAFFQVATVHHDITEIAMWSGTGWRLGFWKHPPLLPWLFRATFAVLGENRLALAFLTALNVTLGAWAVWRIARLCLDEARASLALGLYAVSPLVTVLALKLNHNAVLVSLWPLAILAFLRAVQSPTVLNGIVFGVLAGLSMLAKYYSALLLLACLLALLARSDRWRLLFSPAPWAALVTGLVVWGPNLWWMSQHRLQPIQYAMTSEKAGPWRSIEFGWTTLALLAPIVLLAFWIARRAHAPIEPLQHVRTHLREVVVISLVPFAMTMVLTSTLALRGATMWALPIFSLVPILVAGSLPAPDLARIVLTVRRLPVLLVALALAVLVVETISVRYGATTGEPRPEIVAQAGTLWSGATNSSKLTYAAGDTRLVGETTFSHPDHPLGWPQFDYGWAEWMKGADIASAGLLVLCKQGDEGCISQGAERLSRQGGLSCEITAQRDLGIVKGRPTTAIVQVILPAAVQLAEDEARSLCTSVEGRNFGYRRARAERVK